jgi:hypothetical protein
MLHASRDITISSWIGFNRKWVVARHGNLLSAVWFAVKFDYLMPATVAPSFLPQRGYAHQIEPSTDASSDLCAQFEV